MSTPVLEQFAADPMAAHSGQFPLGRNPGPVSLGAPSPAEVRPWGLTGMRPARQQGDPVRGVFAYDHVQQVAIDGKGCSLPTASEPTAKKNTSNDGDEGPSEDFSYDYCPDDSSDVV